MNCRKSLGESVINGNDEILRLIAGDIIREVLADNVPLDHLWPEKTVSDIYASFVSTGSLRTQWIEEFTAFANELERRSILAHK